MGCSIPQRETTPKIRVVFDTDTNNELDDQHALAYLLFNQDIFKIEAITINTTSSGGNIELQYAEARRVLQLCNADSLPVLKGADQSFQQIIPFLNSAEFDGHAAVARIIEEAHRPATEKLVVLAVGKLTNVALAVAKDSSIANRIRLVWLGSNYPDPGEHNQNNDTVAMNYLLNTKIDFEMVTVRYGKPSGTSVVTITQKEVGEVMPGLGPHISKPVTGRHGGEFYCFGDYSVNLFDHIDYHGDPPARSLFDMAAVAVVKNPEWAQVTSHPAPLFVNGVWIQRPNNTRQIKIWEYFDRNAIVTDFIQSLKKVTEPE
ncbi:MAG: nucleoside hydrolase [Cytophagales bacterium]|nr:nucleoside hydrolase [Cytophagales bacterium]